MAKIQYVSFRDIQRKEYKSFYPFYSKLCSEIDSINNEFSEGNIEEKIPAMVNSSVLFKEVELKLKFLGIICDLFDEFEEGFKKMLPAQKNK